jgi:hypothetical protein
MLRLCARFANRSLSELKAGTPHFLASKTLVELRTGRSLAPHPISVYPAVLAWRHCIGAGGPKLSLIVMPQRDHGNHFGGTRRVDDPPARVPVTSRNGIGACAQVAKTAALAAR